MSAHQPDPQLYPCRACACSALRRAGRAVTQHYEQAFRGSGMRSTQFSLLAVLTQTGPLPVTALASKVGMERTTLTRNLRLLEAKGWISIESNAADHRVRRATLTRAGRSAAIKGLEAWNSAQSGIRPILQRHKVENLLVANEG